MIFLKCLDCNRIQNDITMLQELVVPHHFLIFALIYLLLFEHILLMKDSSEVNAFGMVVGGAQRVLIDCMLDIHVYFRTEFSILGINGGHCEFILDGLSC